MLANPIDRHPYSLLRDGLPPVRLTHVQFRLLALFVYNAGRRIVEADLLDYVFGPNYRVDGHDHSRTVRSYVRYVRVALRVCGASDRLQTVDGGYLFAEA